LAAAEFKAQRMEKERELIHVNVPGNPLSVYRFAADNPRSGFAPRAIAVQSAYAQALAGTG
jgi:hypothetical protein